MSTASIIPPQYAPSALSRRHTFDRAVVQVWETWLDQPPSEVKRLSELLSDDERLRANRFYFPKDQEHYIVGRGTLRSILGGCLSVDPRLLCFRYSAYGKPYLTDEFGGQTIRFNLSHSDGRALFAVTENCEVGVDVERIKADFATLEIAEKFFSPAEVAQLRRLPAELRPQG